LHFTIAPDKDANVHYTDPFAKMLYDLYNPHTGMNTQSKIAKAKAFLTQKILR
jgi:hypothetical protein